MLAKKHKITGSKDYARVQSDGKVLQSENFGMAYLNRKDDDPSRFGFIISTKVAKEAVDRNRYKRAMSDAIRLETINLVPGYDVVFLAKPIIVRASTVEVMKEVKNSLRKIGLIK